MTEQQLEAGLKALLAQRKFEKELNEFLRDDRMEELYRVNQAILDSWIPQEINEEISWWLYDATATSYTIQVDRPSREKIWHVKLPKQFAKYLYHEYYKDKEPK